MNNVNELFLGGVSQKFLQRLLWLVVGLNVILGIQSAWIYYFDPHHFLDNLSVALIGVIGLVVLRRSGFRAALSWLLWATWVALAAVMALRNGLRDPTALAYPLFIVLAGWLLGRSHAYAMLCASLVLAVALTMAEQNGMLVSTSPVGSTMLAAVFVAILAIGTLVSLGIAQIVQAQHDRVLELNSTLEKRVVERTAHLQELNIQLEQTVADLKRTQRELVNSEKLASLGAMVAGISHELNTPIGNALTASTTLTHEVGHFVARSQEPTMSRATIREFGEQVAGLSDLLERSMRRASELITSFKRVAVDRTSERRQKFALRKAIEQLLMALRPTLKQSPWNIHVEGPDDLVLDSYPGPLEQVISNLLINAFMHAFEGREQGTVSIILKAVKKTSPETGVWVRIDVLDDGVGMGATVAQRIFEPFFTTKMGRGGSGLGLSISHSIVTGLLGGTLNVETAPGQGTRFVLELPTIAPMTAPISESATTSP